MIFRISILVIFIGLFAFAIAVIIVHPGCEKEPELNWWEKSMIYRVDISKLDAVPKNESSFKSISSYH